MEKVMFEDNEDLLYTSREKQEESGMLELKYHSGEVRRVNLPPTFFSSYEYSISSRALDIAYQYGRRPYFISVTKGEYSMFEQTIRANQPDIFKGGHKNVDEKKVKKQLRKECKNMPLRKISFNELNSFS